MKKKQAIWIISLAILFLLIVPFLAPANFQLYFFSFPACKLSSLFFNLPCFDLVEENGYFLIPHPTVPLRVGVECSGFQFFCLLYFLLLLPAIKPPSPLKGEKKEIFPADKAIKINTPVNEEQIRKLKTGDIVLISGKIYTGRDAIHKHLHDTGESPVNLDGQLIYHCGPVMIKDESGKWQVKGAGPTTSIREEPYQGDIIKKFGMRMVMGKGGMGAKTSAALKEYGAVYLNAIGGAAQYYSACIKNVKDVHLLNFGIPEAMWEFEVEDFPAIVTMDSHGESLHADVDKSSFEKLCELKDPVF